jgi:hypothetical protein
MNDNKKIAEELVEKYHSYVVDSGDDALGREEVFKEIIAEALNKARLQTFEAMKERCKEISKELKPPSPLVIDETATLHVTLAIRNRMKKEIAEAIDKIKLEDLG